MLKLFLKVLVPLLAMAIVAVFYLYSGGGGRRRKGREQREMDRTTARIKTLIHSFQDKFDQITEFDLFGFSTKLISDSID